MPSNPNALQVAAECLKRPRQASVWLPAEKRYAYPESSEGLRSLLETAAGEGTSKGAPYTVIESNFKLIFLTAAGGTLLFTLLCVGLHIAVGGEPPPPMEKLIQGMFDLVKIGFGAIVGLLVGKSR